MRILMKRLGAIFVSTIIVCGSLTHVARARALAAPITITVAFKEVGAPPYFQALAWQMVKQRIEASNPRIKVRLFPIIPNTDRYEDTLNGLLQSPATTPDVVSVDSYLIPTDAAAGYLAPLDSDLATWPDYRHTWQPSMQHIATFKGHTYGVVTGSDVRVVWYNKRVFRQARLPLSWQPRDWSDILHAASTIKARVPSAIPLNLYAGTPMGETSAMEGFEMLLYGTRTPLYNTVTGKWVVGGKGLVDSLGFIERVYAQTDPLGPPPDTALSAVAASEVKLRLLPEDRLGIAIDGSWIRSSWYAGGARPWPQWQQVMGYAKMPTEFGQAPHYVTLAGGWTYAISARSTHKREAFALIKAFCDRDALAAYDVNIGAIAPRTDIPAHTEYSATPLTPFFQDLSRHARFRPTLPPYPQISSLLNQATQDIVSGTAPSTALATYAQAVTQLVGAHNVERQ